MAWSLEISPQFELDYRKLCAKNAALLRAVDKKVAQILLQPARYKPLRAPLAGVRRLHVASSFVILFEAAERTQAMRLLRLAHHEEAYGR